MTLKRTKPLSKEEKEEERKAANARVLAEYKIVPVKKSVRKEKEEDKT